jgi:hypothetical protein
MVLRRNLDNCCDNYLGGTQSNRYASSLSRTNFIGTFYKYWFPTAQEMLGLSILNPIRLNPFRGILRIFCVVARDLQVHCVESMQLILMQSGWCIW